MALNTYSTGTVSVTSGGAVTVAGGVWTGPNVVAGDMISVDGAPALLISDVSDTTHGQLVGWSGGAVSGKSYVVYKCSSLRFDDVQMAEDAKDIVAAFNTEGFYHFVPPDATAPDPSLGDDGQYAFQATTGKMWLKVGGVWTYLGIYKGVSFKGAWSSATAYAVGDVVAVNGTSYVCILAHTNHAPPNSTYWTVFASKGDDGGALVAPYIYGSALTGGRANFNNAVSQKDSTVIDISNTDSRGLDFSAVFASLATGTSAAKAILRVYKSGDQTKFLVFRVTALNANSGYYAANVTGIASSAASPFTSGDALVYAFSPVGDKGNTGNAATLAVGNVSTGLPGTNVIITNSGTSGAAVLDITIPRGTPGAGDMSSVNYGSEYAANTTLFAANLDVPQYQLKKVATDFNTVTDDGFYMTDGTCTNVPYAAQWYIHVSRYENANSVVQRAYKLWPGDTSEAWIRTKFLPNGWNDWRRIDAQREYIGFYNGYSPNTTPAGIYNIGVARATDPLSFGRVSVLAPVWNDANTYGDNSGRINPHPIRVGDEIWVYYEGFNGTNKSIFMLRTDLQGNLREKPIMPIIPYSSVSGATAVCRPAVLYDPDDATWPFKMVFTRALSGITTTSLMSARSKDGIAWIVIGEIHNVASGAAWENTYLETTGRLFKDGIQYRLLYAGHNGSYWQTGEMHSSDFATWTRNGANPMLSPRGGYLQPLTANVVVGSKTLKVANSALFDVGAPIAICENGTGSTYQMNRIAAIPDATTLTTLYAIEGNYTTAINSCVSQIHSRSVEVSEVWVENGIYRALIVCFQFVKNGVLVETMGYAETPNMSTDFTIKPAEWPLPMIEKQKVWDQVSAENLKFIRLR